tara:strand:- start:72337 stop:72639 length:303 start_codon:yes stop_codon:yes gene_type:complete
MSFDPHIVLTILAMAAATAFTRLSGYWIISLVEPGPRLRRFLDTAPQTVFVAMIAPPIWNGGPAEWMGAVAAAVAMKLSGNLALTIAAGVGTTAVIRYLL